MKRDRRHFLKHSTALALAGLILPAHSETGMRAPSQDTDLFIIGPKSGFSPQVGTLVSMMNWTRKITTTWASGLSVEQLDFLVEPNANSIGGLLLHIITQEKECQVQTFKWDREEIFSETDAYVAKLGDKAREKIKGNDVDFYLAKLIATREKSMEELKRRDDAWLMEVDDDHPWGLPVNNYCQWFHVLEHECQHAGQISFIKNQMPTSKE